MCTLVATSMILQSLKCIFLSEDNWDLTWKWWYFSATSFFYILDPSVNSLGPKFGTRPIGSLKFWSFFGLRHKCIVTLNTLPTHVGAGHQRTESTNTSCNQWLSLAKIALKIPLADRTRSLVANTSRCGEGIS